MRQLVQIPLGAIAGAAYPLQALGLLAKTPALWGYIIFPILINAAIGAVLYFVLLQPGWAIVTQWTIGLPVLTAQWVASLPAWAVRLLGWLPSLAAVFDDVLRWVLAIVLLVVTGFLLVQFGAIFGAPWYGSLAEQIERLQMGKLPDVPMTWTRSLTDIRRAIAFQLKKLVLLAGVGVPLLLLNFLPLPGISTTISSIGQLSLFAVLVGLDFFDPPLERRRLSFRQKLGIFGRTLPASATFSGVCLALVSIPLLNLLAVPLCVAAGTLFCCDRVLPHLSGTQPPELEASDG